MIALLLAFIVYQLYRLAVRFTIGLTLLTIFDVFVVWLTGREYQAKRSPTRNVNAHRRPEGIAFCLCDGRAGGA